MKFSDLLPACGLAVSVSAILCLADLLPFGRQMLLVRLADADTAAGVVAAEAALVGIPAPGYAVVYGDAARVRAAMGVAVVWNGRAGCGP